MVTLASDISTALSCIRTTESLMALISCMDHKPQHGLRWVAHGTHISMAPGASKAHGHHHGIRQHHRPPMSTCISGFIAAWGSSMDHRHQHGLQWHHRPWWSFEEVHPENEPFLILDLHHCPEPGGPHSLYIYCMSNNLYSLVPH